MWQRRVTKALNMTCRHCMVSPAGWPRLPRHTGGHRPAGPGWSRRGAPSHPSQTGSGSLSPAGQVSHFEGCKHHNAKLTNYFGGAKSPSYTIPWIPWFWSLPLLGAQEIALQMLSKTSGTPSSSERGNMQGATGLVMMTPLLVSGV